MSSIVRNNAALIIYVALALLMYLGVYAGNEAPLLIGIGLFLALTSYFLTWDLLTSAVLSTLRIIHEMTYAGQSAVLSIAFASPLRIRLPARMQLVCSPHLLCNDDYHVVINGPQEQINIRARWFGVAEVLGVIIKVSDPLDVIRNSRFIKIGREVPIEPGKEALLGVGDQRAFGDYVSNAALTESRMGDFMYLRNYNFLEPASNIHWITSARVNDLISAARSEVGNVPRLIVMEYTPRMLRPVGNRRPIDEALMYLGHLRGSYFMLILIGNGLVRSLNVTSNTSLADLELKLRELVMGFEDRQELISKAMGILGRYVMEVSIEELMRLLYPIRTDRGLSMDDIGIINRYLRRNSLLLITKESLNDLVKANVDLRNVNVIILGE
ncbi:hypothetical protein JCM16161A_24100 [Vulcanisaeta sp. JCM 16161]|uniref:DUF58 domain-containing protein n=1 Tax=Vulcanisaeta sp. JCM 16161 TaxID=1295372 RepID=UPI0006D0F29D|nr:DUF58 domain-containing protein [Vulcanisaeta sp. JCM 16161]